MPTYKVTQYIEAEDEMQAKMAAQTATDPDRHVYAERHYTDAEIDAYREECNENGEVACTDPEHHVWAVSDENDNYCYCEKCGCCEY